MVQRLADRRRRLDAHSGTNALAGTDITSLSKNSTVELTLANPGNISLTGYTGLRLGISGSQPGGDNHVQFATLEHSLQPEPQLVVTYSTSGGASAPSNTSVPVVSGVAQVGQTLTASTGSWSGTSPISYAYQWQRCSPGCVAVAGATESTYVVAAADLGAHAFV